MLVDFLLEAGVGADDVTRATAQAVLIIVIDLVLIDELDIHARHQVGAHVAEELILALILVQAYGPRL